MGWHGELRSRNRVGGLLIRACLCLHICGISRSSSLVYPDISLAPTLFSTDIPPCHDPDVYVNRPDDYKLNVKRKLNGKSWKRGRGRARGLWYEEVRERVRTWLTFESGLGARLPSEGTLYDMNGGCSRRRWIDRSATATMELVGPSVLNHLAYPTLKVK